METIPVRASQFRALTLARFSEVKNDVIEDSS